MKVTICLCVSIAILGLSISRAANYVPQIAVRTGDIVDGRTITGFAESPAINSSGTLAYYAAFAGGEGIFVSDTLNVSIGDTVDGKTLTGLDHPSLSDAGQIAYRGIYVTGAGYFIDDALAVAVGDIIDGKTVTGLAVSPAIDASGNLAFLAAYDGGNGIFFQDSLKVSIGDTVDGKSLTGLDHPALNNAGEIAYRGIFGSGHGLFVDQSLQVEYPGTVAGQVLTGLGVSPAISDNGDLAFLAGLDGVGSIVLNNVVVAREGDTVDGITLTGIDHPAMSSKGDIAFRSSFSDGSHGIIVLELVPEPSTLLFAVSCIGLAVMRRVLPR